MKLIKEELYNAKAWTKYKILKENETFDYVVVKDKIGCKISI